jgi:RNA polymerase sigma-70 factor (ECF subfamily)
MCENLTSNQNPENTASVEQFVRLLLANEKRIYAFILTLVANRSDADDLMQETATIMWQKYRQALPVSGFAAWGIGIAHYKILEFRKKQYKLRVQFDSELFEHLVGGAMAVTDKVDDRLEALENCLAKLTERDCRLVKMRHESGVTTKSVAERIGISTASAYKAIARIHNALLICVYRTLNAEGAS